MPKTHWSGALHPIMPSIGLFTQPTNSIVLQFLPSQTRVFFWRSSSLPAKWEEFCRSWVLQMFLSGEIAYFQIFSKNRYASIRWNTHKIHTFLHSFLGFEHTFSPWEPKKWRLLIGSLEERGHPIELLQIIFDWEVTGSNLFNCWNLEPSDIDRFRDKSYSLTIQS